MHKQLETVEKTFTRKILIGSCSIKSISNYCLDNEELTNFCKRNSNRNSIHSISTHEDAKEDPLINFDKVKKIFEFRKRVSKI